MAQRQRYSVLTHIDKIEFLLQVTFQDLTGVRVCTWLPVYIQHRIPQSGSKLTYLTGLKSHNHTLINRITFDSFNRMPDLMYCLP